MSELVLTPQSSQFLTDETYSYSAIAYDTTNAILVIATKADGALTTVLRSYSMNSTHEITALDVVAFSSSYDEMSMAYDSTSGCFAIVQVGTGNGAIFTVDASGDITIQQSLDFGGAIDYPLVVATGGGFLFYYKLGDRTFRAGTISGTTLTFGSSVDFTGFSPMMAYSPDHSTAVMIYIDSSPYYVKAIPIVVSGNSVSLGNPLTLNSDRVSSQYISYDSVNGKFLTVFPLYSEEKTDACIVSVSGSTLSKGTVYRISDTKKINSADLIFIHSEASFVLVGNYYASYNTLSNKYQSIEISGETLIGYPAMTVYSSTGTGLSSVLMENSAAVLFTHYDPSENDTRGTPLSYSATGTDPDPESDFWTNFTGQYELA